MKLVAVYDTPDDKAAFDRHYDEVHAPLAKAVPGLSELRVTRMANRLMGKNSIYLVAELVFPDQMTLDAAMSSDENKAAARDLTNFADGKVTLFIGKSEQVLGENEPLEQLARVLRHEHTRDLAD